MTTFGRVQLTLSLLAYFILCCTGLFGVKKFNGTLRPMDPDVCETQNITFTSELLEDPKRNFSIGFAVMNISKSNVYVAVEYDRIIKINETMSQFTMYNIHLEKERATKEVYVYVGSYYWQEFGDTSSTLQLGYISSSRIYPLPEEVQNFSCIVMNYLSMRCTWSYGKEYEKPNMPDVIFLWRIPTFSWTNCSDLSIDDGYCNWNGSTAGYFKHTNMTIRLTVIQKCDINASTDFHIDTQRIVKPNPVSSISTKVINSTCIQLLWSTANSEPQNPKEHSIIVSTKEVNITNKRFNTTDVTESDLHNWTFCKLQPYTEYTFSVRIQPIDFYSGFFSDPRHTTAMTYSDIPSASPELTEGGYSWSHKACDGTHLKRNVCTFWKNENDPTLLGSWRIQAHSGNIVDIITRLHWCESNHVGYKKLLAKVQSRYEGIPRSIIQDACRSCPVCLMSVRQTNNAELKPILSSGFLTRAQIDLIDMRHKPDGEHHYIAHFMDHWSKFHVIWPLKRKTAEEVAMGLNERVFPYVGTPRILHSDNGREFVNKIVRELVKDWGGENDVLFINGRPRHSQSQGLVEQGNATIERHIANKRATLGLTAESSYPWASWLPKIMYNMNTEVAEGIRKMPYEVVFGQPPRTNIFPDAKATDCIINEEDLNLDQAPEATTSPQMSASTVPRPATERPTPKPRKRKLSTQKPLESTESLTNENSVTQSENNSVSNMSDNNHPSDENNSTVTQTTPEPRNNEPDEPIINIVHETETEPDSIVLGTSVKHQKIREEADISYRKNAEVMKMKYSKRKRTTSVTFVVGDTATIRVPKIDRSCTDQPRLRVKVIEVKGDSDKLFKLQCAHGVINGWFRAGDMMPYEQAYKVDYDCTDPVSLREASRKENPNHVNRKKCMCKAQCSKLCYCRRNNMKCSSHCHPLRTCDNVETEQLTLDDRRRIQEEMELTDQHMSVGQKLLKDQFKLNNGLKDTLICASVHSEPTPYVQVFHINGNHWVVVASNNSDGPIEVYDSLSNGKPSKATVELLRHYHGKNCTIKVMNVQQQSGSKDCGVFALANATALCLGDDPTSIVYDQTEMRNHLSACLDTHIMTMFPHEVKRCKRRSIKDEHKNGPMKGLRGLFYAINTHGHSVQIDWAEDLTYGCSEILCDTSYNFTIKARNVNGTSERGSTIRIPSFSSGLKRPQFIVESANTSDVYISWDYTEKPNAKKFIVAWCRNKNGDCKTDHEVNWKSFPSNTTEAVLQINTSANDFLYGVSVLTGKISSGVEWQDCVYTKDALPTREPQNVVVSAGSEDNTLVVTWDKLTCKLEEPYIYMYHLRYKVQDTYEKALYVTQSSESRVVLKDLEEDQTYLVTVRGVTKDGRYGPSSQQVSGIPVNKSLKPSEITGISMAVLVCVIFAAVGCICAVRRCKHKAQKAIEQAGAITIPDDPGLEFNTSFGRQNSDDSGFDRTPPPDVVSKGRELSSMPYVIQHDYSYVNTGYSAEGTDTDTTTFKQELMRSISGPEMSVSKTELFCEASQITRGPKLTLVIPKPLVFTERSESGISFSSEETKVTMETMQAKSSDYVQCKKASFNSEDDNDNQIEAFSNDNNNEASMKHCDNNHTQLTQEETEDKTYNVFPLGNAQLITNIPCPSRESSSIDDENELPLTLTENNCQNLRHTASTIAISQSELPIISTKNVIHNSTNSKPSNYVTTTDANSLYLQSASVSTDIMRKKSGTNASPNNFVSKQSAEPQANSEYVTLPQYSKSDISQISDTSMVDEKCKKSPCSVYVHQTTQFNASDYPQTLGAVQEQYVSQRSVPADISVAQNVTRSNNAHQLTQQPSSSDFQNQTVSSINAFEHETSSNGVMNCEMARTNGYIPHSNAFQDKLIDNNALNSTVADDYVPHANMITNNVTSNDVQSYIPNTSVGIVSGIETKTYSNSTAITAAISKKLNLGYVLSTDWNGVCQPTAHKLDFETREVVKNLDNYVSHSDVNILNKQIACPLTKPYKHNDHRDSKSETTEDMDNGTAQVYVADVFVMQNETVNVNEKANSEQEPECECVPLHNDGYISHVV